MTRTSFEMYLYQDFVCDLHLLLWALLFFTAMSEEGPRQFKLLDIPTSVFVWMVSTEDYLFSGFSK